MGRRRQVMAGKQAFASYEKLVLRKARAAEADKIEAEDDAAGRASEVGKRYSLRRFTGRGCESLPIRATV